MFKSKPTAKKLLIASSKGDSTKIKRYLKAGIKVDIADDNGKTPLHLACSSGSESSVTTLLTSGGDVFAKDTNGCVPLHFVGKSDVISALLDSVTKENAFKMLEEVDNGGKTALHYAVQNGNTATTRTLILRNSNIDKTDNAGKTPLEYALSDKFKAELQKILMEKDKKDGEDSQKLLDIFKRGDISTLKQIIQNGKNVNSKNLEGQTFIHISAITQLKDVSIFLLEQGIDVNIKDNSQKTPLHYCAINGVADITELLLVDGKCDPDPKDGFLSTPLHYAAEWNKPKVIQILLENKANIEEKNGEGCTALHQACKYGRMNAFNILLQNKANLFTLDNHQRTPLHYATKWGRVKILGELLKENVNINAQDDEGKTVLHYSSEIRKEPILSLLLSNNANSIIDQSQRTPLHILLQWPKPRNISLQSGVEVFNSKKAPIHTNAIQSHNQCAILLIQHMLKETPSLINYQDIDGRTPLHWAIINRHKEIAIYLITEAYADVNIVDKLKATPLSPLTQSSHRDIAQEIEKAAASARIASPERKKKKKSKTKSSSEFPNDFIEQGIPHDLAEINNLFNSGQIKIEEVMEKKFADKQNIFHLVATGGHWDLFISLLPSASIDLLNVRDNYGHTPLLLAARNGHEKIVVSLIKAGADLKMEELENIDKGLYDKLLEMETISDICCNKKEEFVFQKEIQCD